MRKSAKQEVPRSLEGSGVKPLPATNGPVVFMFQPTHYKQVKTPEELQLFMRCMLAQVHLDPDKYQLEGPGGSISGSGGVGGGWDD
jgi:hypothetical protein